MAPADPANLPRVSLRAVLWHNRLEAASGTLLLAMALFCPWAFGTTQPWAIWTMNVAGYAVGGLLVLKLGIRRVWRHEPARWGTPAPHAARGLTLGLAGATVLLLGFTFIAALNARAEYHPGSLTLDYRDHLAWLPHSYHRARTWAALFDYVAWAAAFWALRDWLLGMTSAEARAARAGEPPTGAIPRRLKLLLWVLAVNGAVLGVEGVIQRLEGSGKLLFLVQPRVNPEAITQFGPFAYRSNAAQYLNLIWPVTLGFWWWVQQTARRGTTERRRSGWLLVCAIIMAACPIITSSRAGALTGMALLAGAVAILITARRADGLRKLAVLAVFGLALAAGVWLGWNSLNPRLGDLAEGWRTRELMYETARLIARDHPVFGTGPGTFEHMFQLYRQSLDEYWPAQLHNDWLELRLTFGWTGLGLMLAALGAVVAHGLVRGRIAASRRFIWLGWLALAGCLLQARWDFPFRTYSVVMLFLTVCAVLTIVGRAPSRS